jgi:hypothetical protein
MTLLDSFTVIDWTIIAAGCGLLILIPSLLLTWIVVLPAFVMRLARIHRPDASDTAGIDAEWADIEEAMRTGADR